MMPSNKLLLNDNDMKKSKEGWSSEKSRGMNRVGPLPSMQEAATAEIRETGI